MANERQPRLEVVEIDGGAVTYTMPLRDTTPKMVDLCERGLLRRFAEAGRLDEVFVRPMDVEDDSATQRA